MSIRITNREYRIKNVARIINEEFDSYPTYEHINEVAARIVDFLENAPSDVIISTTEFVDIK